MYIYILLEYFQSDNRNQDVRRIYHQVCLLFNTAYTIGNYFIIYLEPVINPNPLSLIYFPNAYQHT